MAARQTSAIRSMKHKPFAEDATSIILESISDGVFTVDRSWRITTFNRAAEAITAISRQEAVGKYCWEVFRSNMCETGCPLHKTMETGEPQVNVPGYIVTGDGDQRPVRVSTGLLSDKQGHVLGGVETFRDVSEVEHLRRQLQERFQVGDMVSRSQAMAKIFKVLPRISESRSTVLIQGETGTGKELLAKAIHHLSPRREKPFVPVHCAALPDTLLESELFGYKAGAFTDAGKDKKGQFALADGGTIFLDEIGETTQAFQVKLLRVLQEREFTPLGGTSPVRVDVRILAATNKDLSDMVDRQEFRQDLYYRINVVSLELPPLRERKEDIPLLVDHFVNKLNALYGKTVQAVSQSALSLLMAHDYPGNIRELENVLEHAFVLCNADLIQETHLPEHLRSQPQAPAGHELKKAVTTVEAQTIREALERNQGNVTRTARELGMHKSTLYRKMKKLRLSGSARGRTG
jgi:PAS domain S-box-containing protein